MYSSSTSHSRLCIGLSNSSVPSLTPSPWQRAPCPTEFFVVCSGQIFAKSNQVSPVNDVCASLESCSSDSFLFILRVRSTYNCTALRQSLSNRM